MASDGGPGPGQATGGARLSGGIFLLYLTPVIWGATFPAMKLVLDDMHLLGAMAWSRSLGAVTLVASLALVAPGALRAGPLRRVAAPGALLGGLIFLGYLFQTWGLEHTTATNAGFITGLYVVLTPVLTLILFRRPGGRAVWTAVAVSVAGLALLSVEDLQVPRPRAGDLLVLVSAVAWAGQVVALGRLAPRHPPLPLALAQMGWAASLHLVATAAGPGLQPSAAASVWGLLVVTGVLGSGVAFTLQVVAQTEVDATRAVIVLAGESLAAAAFAAFWIGERLALHQWVGASLVLAAMTVSELGARRRAAIHLAPGTAP